MTFYLYGVTAPQSQYQWLKSTRSITAYQDVRRDPKEVFRVVFWSVGGETQKGVRGIKCVGVLTLWLDELLAG